MPFIPLEVYANNATTTVTDGGGTAPPAGTQETWTVTNADAFPVIDLGATQFHVADPAAPAEMVTVLSRSGSTWLVRRGADGTAPVAHAPPFTAVQVVTAGTLTELAWPAWQFPVQRYGAQGDGKIGSGGTGTSGSPAFSDAGASFVNAAAPAGDVGKAIIINQGAGSATVPTNPFVGTITAVNSPTSVTLSGNLGANCSSAPYIYGTDDAAPIRAAVSAAEAWAKATGNYKAQVIFQPGAYMLRSLLQQSSPVKYNCHIPVPFSGEYERRLTIDFTGTGDAGVPDYWGSTLPGTQGTCLVSAAWTAAEPNGTYGQQAVIGAPNAATGLGDGGITGMNYANVLVNITGITVVTPFNSEQHSIDLRYALQCWVDQVSAVAFAPVNYSGQAVGGPWLRNTMLPANGVAAGLAMPLVGNNDNCNIGNFAAEGIAIACTITEHATAQRLTAMYCTTGLMPMPSVPSGTYIHGGAIQYLSIEGCQDGIATYPGAGSNCVYPLSVGLADFEAMRNGYYVNDPNNVLTGELHWTEISFPTPVAAGAAGINGAANYKIVNDYMSHGPWAANAGRQIAAPPAAPSSGTAQQNSAYRDASLYISATTGITGASVGPASTGLTALGLAAGNGVVTLLRVPSGHWYSVTYSGTLTVKWVLD